MTGLHELLSTGLTYRLGWMLLHSLWQGAVVAGVFGLLLLVIPRSRANARYVAGCLSLLAILVLCIITFVVIEPPDGIAQFSPAAVEGVAHLPPARTDAPVAVVPRDVPAGIAFSGPAPPLAASQTPPLVARPADATPAGPWRDRVAKFSQAKLTPMLPALALLWMLGVSVLSLWRMGGVVATYRLRTITTASVSEEIRTLVVRLAERLRVSRPVRAFQSAVLQTPAVIGHLRPVILLPLSALTGLSAEQIEAIIAHELAHIRRHDYLVNILQTVVETLLFHHPAVWWISRRIRAERENCCDDLALTVCRDRLTYARALAQIGQLGGAGVSLAAAAAGGSLLGRIRRIAALSDRGNAHFSRWLAGAVTTTAVIALATCLHMAACVSGPKESVTPNAPATRPTTRSDAGEPARARILSRTPSSRESLPASSGEGEAKAPLAAHSRMADANPLKGAVAMAPGAPGSTQPAEPVSMQPAQLATRPAEGVLSLRVIDRQTKEPLAGVSLKIWVNRSESKGQTDESGTCRIELKEVNPQSVSVSASKVGFSPLKVSWNSRNGKVAVPGAYTLAMEPGTLVGGIVQDEDGKPIAGVKVSLLVLGRDGESESPDLRDDSVTTGVDGHWRCDVMPSKATEALIRLEHPDYTSDTMFGQSTRPSLKQLRAMTAVSTMGKGYTVTGTVRGPDGRPLAGVKVRQGSDRFSSLDPQTKTDADGWFRFSNAQPGEMILTVHAPGLAPDLVTITVTKNTPPVEFHLQPGNTIRGIVINQAGEPVPGAFVAADTWRKHRSIQWETRTDDQGRFTWTEAPKDEVLFDMGKRGYMNVRKHALVPSDQEQLIVLMRPLHIQGRVVDAETGEPIGAFKLIPGILWDTSKDDTSWDRRSVQTFTNGQYDLTLDQPRPGHVIRIAAEGYKTGISRVFKSDEGEQTLDFQLERGAGPTGIVRLPDGNPASGATVALAIAGRQLSILDNQIVSQNPVSTETDAAGRFSLPHQPEHGLIVVIHDRGWAHRTEEELAKDPNIPLQPWTKVEGTYRTHSKAGTPQSLVLFVSDRTRRVEKNVVQVSWQYRTTSDRDGHFAFKGVRAGEGQIDVRDKSGDAPLRVHVTIKPGETLIVTFGGKGRPIVGRFVAGPGTKPPARWGCGTKSLMPERAPRILASSPAPSEESLISVKPSYSFAVEADGSFRAEDVEPGTYYLNYDVYEPPADSGGAWGKRIGLVYGKITVPEIPAGHSDEPLDVGTLVLDASDKPITTRPAATQPTTRADASDSGDRARAEIPRARASRESLPASKAAEDLPVELSAIVEGNSKSLRQMAIASFSATAEEHVRRAVEDGKELSYANTLSIWSKGPKVREDFVAKPGDLPGQRKIELDQRKDGRGVAIVGPPSAKRRVATPEVRFAYVPGQDAMVVQKGDTRLPYGDDASILHRYGTVAGHTFEEKVLECEAKGYHPSITEDVLDGVSCRRLAWEFPESQMAMTIWVSPSQGHLIRKLQFFLRGQVVREWTARLKEYEKGLFWYEEVEERQTKSDGSFISHQTVRVTSLTLNASVDDKLFTLDGLDLPVGTKIQDRILNNRYRYGGPFQAELKRGSTQPQ